MVASVYNATEAAIAAKPNLGGAQFASHTWLEPIVSTNPTRFTVVNNQN